MWLKRNEYNSLINRAKDNEEDAELFRRLMYTISKEQILIHPEFVLMTKNVYDEIIEKQYPSNEVKDLKAELEWYKVKYHELKEMKNG